MAPQNGTVSQQLRQLIYYHLDNDFARNALFLAGRLHGLEPRNPDTIHLLALCHLRVGQVKAAYDYSKEKAGRGTHLGCAYVFAQACLGLGQYADGILALERSKGLWIARNHWNKHSHLARQHLPDAAAVYCLLGKLHRANGESKKSVEHSVESLRLNPSMWNAYRDLCDAGIPLQPSQVFTLTADMLSETSVSNGFSNQPEYNHVSQPPPPPPSHIVTPGNDPFTSTNRTAGDPGLNHGGANLLSRLNGSFKEQKPRPLNTWETPTGNGSQNDEDIMMGDAGYTQESDVMQAAPRKGKAIVDVNGDSVRSVTTRSRTKLSEEPESMASLAVKRTISGRAPVPATKEAPSEIPARRSNRLLQHIRPTSSKLGLNSTKEADPKAARDVRKAKAPGIRSRTTASTVGRVVSGNRKVDPADRAERSERVTDRELKEVYRAPSVASNASTVIQTSREPPALKRANSTQPPDITPEREALQWILELLSKLGEAYYHLSRYQTQKALTILQSLPSAQRETPWVLSQIGRAQYERALYTESAETFAKVKRICPSQMEDMEIYSTVLWHTKDELELAYLAHELVELDRLAPQAWVAIGNSFSQQREHEQAIKCFRRATQLDPKFAYGFTLQGHEHVASEELDKAQHAYRLAIAADHRHYNGWYGLGQCYERLAKYEMAEKHYKYAASINPNNSVLNVCIGRVLEKMQNFAGALAHYAKASSTDKNARFMRARVLLRVRRLDEALAELEELKTLVPEEATVHYMLGKCYKMTGRKNLAIRHFTIALNLDPKAAPHIKEALEALEQPSDVDDDEEYDE